MEMTKPFMGAVRSSMKNFSEGSRENREINAADMELVRGNCGSHVLTALGGVLNRYAESISTTGAGRSLYAVTVSNHYIKTRGKVVFVELPFTTGLYITLESPVETPLKPAQIGRDLRLHGLLMHADFMYDIRPGVFYPSEFWRLNAPVLRFFRHPSTAGKLARQVLDSTSLGRNERYRIGVAAQDSANIGSILSKVIGITPPYLGSLGCDYVVEIYVYQHLFEHELL